MKGTLILEDPASAMSSGFMRHAFAGVDLIIIVKPGSDPDVARELANSMIASATKPETPKET